MSYYIGRGQDNEAVLLQQDCETPITDTMITEEIFVFPSNITYDVSLFSYEFDPTTIRDSVVFFTTTSTIEVCHEVHLTDNTVVFDRRIFTIMVPGNGKFLFPVIVYFISL